MKRILLLTMLFALLLCGCRTNEYANDRDPGSHNSASDTNKDTDITDLPIIVIPSATNGDAGIEKPTDILQEQETFADDGAYDDGHAVSDTPK